MKNQNMQPSVVDEAVMAPIQARIKCVRNVQVMLDRDIAELYGVPVKRLNEQVKRNLGRFPADFMFQLTKDDCLRSQIATLNGKRGMPTPTEIAKAIRGSRMVHTSAQSRKSISQSPENQSVKVRKIYQSG